jgi:hypothetical protein
MLDISTGSSVSAATSRSTVMQLSVFGLGFPTILSKMPVMSSIHGNVQSTEMFKKKF